jgi:hypothetical protein
MPPNSISPDATARAAGFLWLVVIIVSVAAIAAPSVNLHGTPAETAASVLATETPYRLAFAALLFGGLCYLGVTALLYELLKPVNASIAFFGALASLAGLTVGAASGVHTLSALTLLHDAAIATPAAVNQLQGLAQAALREDPAEFKMGMVYFGCHVASIGYLIVRSNFLPRIIGALLIAGGASYLITSFATFIAPAFGARLSPLVIPIAILGEGSITLWLLIKGVNVEKWRQTASV